ncbi:MAG: ABC transporter substrate-binding protein [Candidatus Promineifilaceae bacterium]|nr:ABC transporter substrate-binding protein [Candidatus Promineifilaceae bacterium]
MNFIVRVGQWIGICLLVLALAGCDQSGADMAEVNPTTVPESPAATETPVPTRDPNLIVIATDAPLPPFTQFDELGNIEGFNHSAMEVIASNAEVDFEFVVTPHQGVLEILAGGESSDFDAVMSSLLLSEHTQEGITYTSPYLEIGQVLVVLADENELLGHNDIKPGMPIGVLQGSQGELTAKSLPNIMDSDLFNEYETIEQVVQALLDETVRGIIIDNHSADFFATSFPQQLKIPGGSGPENWIDAKSYGIAVASDNKKLLDQLNLAIERGHEDGTLNETAVRWLVTDDLPTAAIDPGESRTGTPDDELFIGVIGQLQDMDPATFSYDLINWEIMSNSMSGLYMFDPDNELQPVLARALPSISADKLEYTIQLKEGLVFPDGTELTAEDVRWSVIRASRLGNFLVNGTLKDSNEDNFADFDAVQVIDPLTVKFILQEPTAYFTSMLATPPYFPISSECYAETADPGSICGGLGPYRISSWLPGDRITLEANPEWPGWTSPAQETIIIRFYDDAAGIKKSLIDFQSIDLAWTGLSYNDFAEMQTLPDGSINSDLKPWLGPSSFKSYLIFNHDSAPWENIKVRQAASYAIDRQAIVDSVFGESRISLLSPIPDEVPGHVSTFPARDADQVASLMLEAGYTTENPLEVTIWFVDDGRYSDREEQYINLIRDQLNATGIFRVEVAGAPWDQFRVQIAECGYESYLLGWPSPGRPVDYLDPSSWTDFFVQETDSIICSNFESPQMDALVQAAREETDPSLRAEIYAQIQELWADELPTLDVTQEPRRALSLTKVDNLKINAHGFLHYEYLTKESN